ncbi:hypothetical protein [Caballeronia sp. 15711]|uniref:hypothetical protein n=1 Tax=Caballeronia sp. 15711 TaxID=3391029 RepID=UPI0039E5A6CE
MAEQLRGTEQFLKLQNDSVRLQATAEADALRRHVKQLQERVDHLILDNDQYRRALSKHHGRRGQPGRKVLYAEPPLASFMSAHACGSGLDAPNGFPKLQKVFYVGGIMQPRNHYDWSEA